MTFPRVPMYSPYPYYPTPPPYPMYAAPPMRFPAGMVRAAQVSGDYDLVSGFDADAIGADDADAAALLSGLDVGAIGAEMISGGDLDLIGAEMISGADDVEVGARRPRRRGAAMAQALALGQIAKAARIQKAMAAQPVISEKPYTKARILPLGIDSNTEIAASNTLIISVQANGPFRPDYLIIPDDVAPDFVIYLLAFGRVNGLGGASELPASTYLASEAREYNKFDCGVVQVGSPIQIGVRNVSGAARRFRGRFQGAILES